MRRDRPTAAKPDPIFAAKRAALTRSAKPETVEGLIA
jgi:hypothetical protein